MNATAAPASGTRVIVGLSGGVDSAVAAWLLREAGYDVQALFMSNWDEDDSYCTAAQDYQDARAIARELDIVLHRVSFAEQYRAQVFAHFLREYRAGRTPNPDVLCNREIKFGLCLDYIARLGADWFATGHYARRLNDADGPVLARAADEAKDQSYFLHGVPRERLARVLFPLGELRKDRVRELARRAGLRIHDKPDSTGICFIGERPFAQFLQRYLPATPGPIESVDGRVLGTHRGLPFYTLGQRAGLAVGGARGLPAEPWYVLAKRPERNALIVVQRHQQRDLEAAAVRVGELNWLCQLRTAPFRASVQLRHRQSPQPAWVEPLPSGGAQLRFEQPQRAATPGQYGVLYEGQRCLGGGVIESVELPAAAQSADAVSADAISAAAVSAAEVAGHRTRGSP